MNKTAAMRIRMEPGLHQQFLAVCKQKDRPAAQVLRDFMRDYVEKNPIAEQADMFEAYDKGVNHG